jgi:hypothetical protein
MSFIFVCLDRDLLVPGLNVPDGHVWAGNLGEADGSRETLVTLRIIVLEADLQLDGLEEVALLGLQGVFEELLDVGSHSGWESGQHRYPMRCGCLPGEHTD